MTSHHHDSVQFKDPGPATRYTSLVEHTTAVSPLLNYYLRSEPKQDLSITRDQRPYVFSRFHGDPTIAGTYRIHGYIFYVRACKTIGTNYERFNLKSFTK